jgi:hypothetical protein
LDRRPTKTWPDNLSINIGDLTKRFKDKETAKFRKEILLFLVIPKLIVSLQSKIVAINMFFSDKIKT